MQAGLCGTNVKCTYRRLGGMVLLPRAVVTAVAKSQSSLLSSFQVAALMRHDHISNIHITNRSPVQTRLPRTAHSQINSKSPPLRSDPRASSKLGLAQNSTRQRPHKLCSPPGCWTVQHLEEEQISCTIETASAAAGAGSIRSGLKHRNKGLLKAAIRAKWQLTKLELKAFTAENKARKARFGYKPFDLHGRWARRKLKKSSVSAPGA